MSSTPVSILVNGSSRTLPKGSNIADLLHGMGLAGKRVAVELNGAIVPRSLHAETTLADADRVEVVGAVGGG